MDTLLERKFSAEHPLPSQTRVAPKKLYLESYGCQMNEYDSGLVRSILSEVGYQNTQSPQDAKLILLNTCAVREKAQERVYGRLEGFSALKRKKPRTIIGVLGCMAQNIGDELFAMGLPVDLVVGPDNYRQLPEILERIEAHSSSVAAWNLTHLSRAETYEELQPEVVSGKLAFVTIMRGCDNFCSFCVVPYTRGRERSRSPQSIVDEISALIDKHSVSEVTLLGQNVNSYRYENISFTQLVKQILKETSIGRIRFTSPHPHDFPEELLALMAKEKRFCSQIHLPLQSGSSSVLERMKRDYNREEYLALVQKIRKWIPDATLSTDIIVGFCGETEAEFQDTLSLIEKVGFDMAYMFRYSERDHTSAKKKFKDDVPEQIKAERLRLLIERQQKISHKINSHYVGRSLSVLVEGYSRRSQQELMGRSYSGKAVVFPFPKEERLSIDTWVGKTLMVQIREYTSATLRGVMRPESIRTDCT